ncbi:unnamed protein product [Colias eurytheme]|nr:unnamed protein product [Colias eurytheme]
MGSLGTRFRDCAGLLSMGFAMGILNIDAGSLMDWVFIPTMGDEILRLTHPGQESGDKYSYFPYQSDLNLVSRSAYSSNANPYLFHWIHIFGSLISHKRSINARMNFEGNLADIGLNAIVLVWAFARGGDLTPQFEKEGVNYSTDPQTGKTGEDEEADLLDDDDDDNTPEGETKSTKTKEDWLWIETQGRDPSTWYMLLKAGGFRVPPVVSNSIRRQRSRIGEVRENSVGEYVKEKLVY